MEMRIKNFNHLLLLNSAASIDTVATSTRGRNAGKALDALIISARAIHAQPDESPEPDLEEPIGSELNVLFRQFAEFISPKGAINWTAIRERRGQLVPNHNGLLCPKAALDFANDWEARAK